MSSRGREGDGGAELFQRHGRRLVQAVTHATLVRRRRTQRATTSAGDEQMNERVAKLLAHRAVEEKVDAVVGESQDVEEVTEAGVDLVDEVIEQAVQEVGDALRELSDEEFSDEEQNDDQQQHASCTRVRSGTPVIVVIHRRHRRSGTPVIVVIVVISALARRSSWSSIVVIVVIVVILVSLALERRSSLPSRPRSICRRCSATLRALTSRALRTVRPQH